MHKIEKILRVAIYNCDKEQEDEWQKIFLENQKVITPINYFQTLFAFETYIIDTMKGNVNLLIVDIDYNCEETIKTLRNLWDLYPHLIVVFSTRNFTQYISRLFLEFHPHNLFSIIQTPFSNKEIILETVNQTIYEVQNQIKKSFLIKTVQGFQTVFLNQITYIESELRTIHIKLYSGEVIECYLKLSQIEDILPINFIRIHQSYIINLDYISQLNADNCFLISGENLPISRKNKNVVRERLFIIKGHT